MKAFILIDKSLNNRAIVISHGEQSVIDDALINELRHIAELGLNSELLASLSQVIQKAQKIGLAVKRSLENESRGYLHQSPDNEIQAHVEEEILTLFHNWLRECSENLNNDSHDSDNLIMSLSLIEPLAKSLFIHRKDTIHFCLSDLIPKNLTEIDITNIDDKVSLIEYLKQHTVTMSKQASTHERPSLSKETLTLIKKLGIENDFKPEA